MHLWLEDDVLFLISSYEVAANILDEHSQIKHKTVKVSHSTQVLQNKLQFEKSKPIQKTIYKYQKKKTHHYTMQLHNL